MPRRIHACSSWLSILLSAAMLNAQSVPLPRPPAKPQLHGLFTRYEGQSSPRPAERTATTGVERARAHAPLATAAAPVSGPGLRIDPTQSRHAISPYVYGVNVYGLTDSQFDTLRMPVTRWGGNATSEYNWQVDKSSTAADWYFEIFAQSTTFNPATVQHSAFDNYYETNAKHGTLSYGTVPILGWVAANVPDKTCSYSVKKYGPQQSTDQWAPDCGNGHYTSGGPILNNDPRDADIPESTSMMTQWVQHMVATYGDAAHGGVAVWSLDNEPVYWNGVHQSVHPKPATYDEMTNSGIAYAAAVKAGDPTALVAGPVTSQWHDLFFSAADINAGYGVGAPPAAESWRPWNNPIDRKAHGDIDFIAYYLQQMAAYEKQHGQRILDILDVHGYVPGAGESGDDDTTNAIRLQSPRVFWDPNFILFNDPNFKQFSDDYLLNDKPYPAGRWTAPECVCLIPRMKKWIADNYPGTKTSITEYNLGQHTTLNSGLAEADLLGVFGREGLDYATMWSDVTPTDPISFAFQIYRNYDLNGSAFGDTSVLGQTDNQDQLAIYAAQRADGTVTAMVINKLPTTDLASTLTLSNFGASGAVQVWQYSNANLTKIVRGTDLSVSGGVINAVFPAYSMTMLVIPGSNAGVISSVLNAASLQPAIAPGTLVLVQGNWLDNGTAARTPSIGSSAAVGTTLGGVQVLFDGKAAPVLTVGANYATALVPYSTVGQSTTSVQVQTQAGLSAPFAAPLSATAPAVFTANGSGNGQALAYSFNPALGFPVANSALSPAAASGTLYFFLTGAGVLNPAMGDGSVGAITAQTPAQALTVTIGGAPATVISAVPAGLAALKSVSGILLVGVQVPAGTGEAVGGNFVGTVALIVTVGGASSPAGVTVAIH